MCAGFTSKEGSASQGVEEALQAKLNVSAQMPMCLARCRFE